MAISVVCPGCKARFNVSDVHAGKTGACPKCKGKIKIPEVKQEEVKIHAPEEFAGGGKDTKGRPVLKPIPREETKLQPVVMAGIGAAVLTVLLVAIALRGLQNKAAILVAGLLLISPPLAMGGYSFLRDDELEPYRGRELWIRAVICGLAYAVLWGAYVIARGMFGLTGDMWEWLYVAPIFVCLGAGVAFAAFDLDFGSAALHYGFYLLVTVVLCLIMAVPLVSTNPSPLGRG
jgi:hypothetical protein